MLTYKTNAQSVILSLSERIKGINTLMDKIVREVALTTLSQNLNRVHNQGKTAEGTMIGDAQYSTKATYISLSQSPKKFTPKGKNGKSKFKNGKQHKSGYFSDGYKGFRNAIGRNTSVVNLQLSGLLKTKLQVQGAGKNYKVGFESGYGSDVAEGLEDKYSQHIWGVTQSEANELTVIVQNRINNHLNK